MTNDFFNTVKMLRTRKLLRKWKNVSIEVSTRYNLLPERNARRDHPNTPTRKVFTDKIKRTYYCEPNIFTQNVK